MLGGYFYLAQAKIDKILYFYKQEMDTHPKYVDICIVKKLWNERRGNHVFIEHILSFKKDPMRIEHNFKGITLRPPPKLNYANMSVFYNCEILINRTYSI